jgi:hypothetical protein
MTKTHLFAVWGGRDYVADLDLHGGDHHAIDQQFDQLAFWFKVGLFEPRAHPSAKLFHGLSDPGQLYVFGSTGFQLTHLSGNAFQTLLQFVPSPLVFFQGTDARQVGFRPAFRLLRNAHARLAQILPTRLQFLREPLPALCPLQRLCETLWMQKGLTEVRPDQFVQLLNREKARGTLLGAR